MQKKSLLKICYFLTFFFSPDFSYILIIAFCACFPFGRKRTSLLARTHTESYLEQMKWIASFSSFASKFGRSLFHASPTSQQQFVAPRHFAFSDRQLCVFPGSLPKLCWSKTYWERENYFFKISVRLLLVMLSEKASLKEVFEWGETRRMLYPFQKGFLLWKLPSSCWAEVKQVTS